MSPKFFLKINTTKIDGLVLYIWKKYFWGKCCSSLVVAATTTTSVIYHWRQSLKQKRWQCGNGQCLVKL